MKLSRLIGYRNWYKDLKTLKIIAYAQNQKKNFTGYLILRRLNHQNNFEGPNSIVKISRHVCRTLSKPRVW